MGLGAITDATAHQLPLPPHRVGNGLHSISGQLKVGLGWFVNAESSHSILWGWGFKHT